jgi:hypothetical protein
MKMDKKPENDPQEFDIVITGGPVKWTWEICEADFRYC